MTGRFGSPRLMTLVAGAATVAILAGGVGTATATPAAAVRARHIAGFLTTETGTSSATTRFNVPELTCPHPDVLFEGTTDGAIIFNNARTFADAGVVAACRSGVPSYAAVVNINSAQTQFPDTVSFGDNMEVVVRVTPRRTKTTVSDLTARWSETTTGSGATATETAVGTIGNACESDGCSPVAHFSDVLFYLSQIDGAPLTGATRSMLKSQAPAREARTSVLSADGTDFATRWVSTCTPNPVGHC